MASPSSSALAAVAGGAAPPAPHAHPSSSAAGSPCAACKFLRRKCQPDCVFAPYFPPDNPQKFVHVHRVFGASNVTKLLNELHPFQREDAVNSLAYEAEARLRDPVYGCVGVISMLQHNLRQVQMDLACARSELSKYQATLTATNFININLHPSMAAVGNAAALGREQFLHPSSAQQQQQQMMMMRGYDADFSARVGANGGVGVGPYDGGVVAASMNMLGGQFMKPSPAAGGAERQSIGPS